MPHDPTVSVVVPTFERATYLGECLESLLDQTLPPHQVIVVDDGCTDETAAVLRGFGDRVEVVRTGHLGKPGALNRGMERVTGEYVWIFDDDDVAHRDALERFVDPLERHPEHGFSYGTFHFSVDAEEGPGIGRVLSDYEIPDLEAKGFLVNLLQVDFVGGAALFARRRCYDELGPFDERLLRSQDYEMAVRMARRFTGVRVPGGPTFHYRQHAGLRGPRADRFEPSMRSLKWLEYDQLFFRELHAELSLAEYLPPGTPLEGHRRRAVLQRMAVMATKLLADEAAADLEVVATLDEGGPLEEAELEIVRGPLVDVPYYGSDWILDDPAFAEPLAALAGTSSVVAAISWEIERARGGPAGRAKAIRERMVGFLRERARREDEKSRDVGAEG